MTLQAKKYLSLLHLTLYNLYACPLVDDRENSKKDLKLQFNKAKDNLVTVNKIQM